MENEGPKIEVEQVEPSRRDNSGRWSFQWRVRNLTEAPLSLLSVRVPHGRFKGEEREFGLAVEVAAQDHFILDLVVACREPPNTVIENAFLILLFNWQENHWRFFVRLQITIDHQGRPATTTESITVQQVGFSGISN